MEHSDADEYAAAAEERGVDLPAELTEGEPERDTLSDFFVNAFWTLSTTRHIGFGCGPIPWNYMIEYCQYKELDLEMTDLFVEVLREMDAGYLKFQHDKQKRDTPPTP